MNLPDKCPKCGAAVRQRFSDWTMFACVSTLHDNGKEFRTDKCRINQLEAENAELRAKLGEPIPPEVVEAAKRLQADDYDTQLGESCMFEVYDLRLIARHWLTVFGDRVKSP